MIKQLLNYKNGIDSCQVFWKNSDKNFSDYWGFQECHKRGVNIFTSKRFGNIACGFNHRIGNALSGHFKEKQDIALIFESESENEDNIRLQLGPYQHAESVKYFSLNNEIKVG